MNSGKVLVFGGTTEGRLLCEFLASKNVDFTLCVATDFGKDMASEKWNILTGRIDKENMQLMLVKGEFATVVDATHPYANVVTQNIKEAANVANVKYIRVLRQGNDLSKTKVFASVGEVVDYLTNTTGNVLLTTGTKDLGEFAKLENFENRLFPRILPMVDGLASCLNLGYKPTNVICMQGNFTEEMNVTTLQMVGAKFLVTKDSGDVGGFYAKVSAAEKLDVEVIVIARPTENEDGQSLNAVMEMFEGVQTNVKRFPLFVNLSDRKVVVVGGGNIATRRVITLLSFANDITIVAPKVTESLAELINIGQVKWLEKEFEQADINGAFVVLAATNDRQTNKLIGETAKANGSFVSVCDKKEECNFWFPGVVTGENLVAGIVTQSGDHALIKRTLKQISEVLNNE